MKHIILFAIVLLLPIISMANEKRVKKDDLPNFHKINDTFYRGGQPSDAGILKLRELGIKAVINFRDPNDRVLREKTLVEANDMQFFNPRLSNWFAAKDSEIESILELIQNPENQPVFIHCNRGADRTGTVTAVYRMKFEGWTAEEANREANEYGIGWWQIWMKDYIHDYYRKLNK